MPITFDWSETISNLPGKPIPAAWLETKGKGVKIAFADTGANLGIASLNHLDKAGRKFFTSAPGFSVVKLTGQDAVGEAFGVAGSGHGSLYASLLAGKTPEVAPDDRDLVTGIANDAEVFIIKTTDATGEITTIKHLLAALELSANLGIEIFITGQCISRSEMQFEGITDVEINRVFNLPGVKRMFVFAPLKNRKTVAAWTDITTKNFPSHRAEVFNVAEFPEIFDQVSGSIKVQNIPFLLHGFVGKLLSKTGDSMDMDFSNSGAVTIMGGIAALALSSFKTQNAGALPGRDQFLQLLGNSCKPLPNSFGATNAPSIFKNF
ncbi:MAG: S8 family serine peptidase [Saprospiraceae bacterium]|nr:S8 family serine peptidase [Saprospiraceae bacterium]